jgi:hypothetical protein
MLSSIHRSVPRFAAAIALTMFVSFAGCSYHRHRIGGGPTGRGEDSARQYYIFFGLLRLNEVDTQRLAHDAAGYEILTERSFVDLLLTPLLLPLSITTRTVTVNR